MAKTNKPSVLPQQHPYIKHVRLRNAAPLRDVKVDFKSGLNIIIGKNGSGKTNFMKLLSQLADLFEDKYRGVGCELVIDGLEEVQVTFKQQAAKLQEGKKGLSSRMLGPQLPLLAVATNGAKTAESEILEQATYEVLGPYYSIYSIITVWHGISTYRLPIVDVGADLIIPKSGSVELADAVDDKWIAESHLIRMLFSTIDKVKYTSLSADNSVALASLSTIRQHIMQAVDVHLNRLNEYLPIYSPLQAVRRNDQFQVYHNTAKDEILVKGLVLEYKIGDDWLPFSALSDGTKRIFYLIGELMTAHSYGWTRDEVRLRVDYDKIILLEEPELGIHPQQLQLLLQLIREVSKDHQVIMTTHSPQTLDMLSGQELDRITICEYDPKLGTKMRKLSAARKTKAKAYLRDKGYLSEFWRFSNLEDPD